MRLKSQVYDLEQKAKTMNAAAQGNAFGLNFAEMSEEELDVLLKNLLIAIGKPQDAAAGEVWDKVLDAGFDALTPDNWQILSQFYQKDMSTP